MSKVEGKEITKLSLVLKLWSYLEGQRKRQALLVVTLLFLTVIAETVSLGAVVPFIGILATPDKLLAHPYAQDFMSWAGINTTTEFTVYMTGLFIGIVLLSAAIRMLFLWSNMRISYSIAADLGIKAYKRMLYQPYLEQTKQNSSKAVHNLVHNTTIVASVLQSYLMLASSAFLAVAILSIFLWIDTKMALTVLGIFGIGYGTVIRSFRGKLKRNSKLAEKSSTQMIQSLQEGLGSVRDVIIGGTQDFYSKVFGKHCRPLRIAQGNNIFLGSAPHFFLEALGMILIALLAYYLSQQPGGIAGALPFLGAMAVGAQRLLPAMQRCYHAWAGLTGHNHQITSLLSTLSLPMPSIPKGEPISLNKEIKLDSVHFRYDSEQDWILEDISFNIPKGSRIGIVGITGSGKSTLLDIIMGLLSPNTGNLYIDDCKVTESNLQRWRANIAHVPQNIFLADTSLAENIAFGVPTEEIDMDQVKKVASMAQISEFIEGLPDTYNSGVGERGVRISGGQRQRIGIARALYKQASLLVFDEATSALDSSTEKDVIDAIEALDRELTVVVVAHRLSTVKQCDFIVELREGRIQSIGSYDELMQKSPSFRDMATVNDAAQNP